MDRNQKRRRKEEKRKRSRQQWQAKALEAERVDTCWWEAENAYRGGDHRASYAAAMNGLQGSPTHKGCYYYAWMAANTLHDSKALLAALEHGWKYRLIEDRQHLYVLSNLAREAQKYALAQDVYRAFVDNPANLRQGGDLTIEITQAQYWLQDWERLVERWQEIRRSARERQNRPSHKTGKTKPTSKKQKTTRKRSKVRPEPTEDGGPEPETAPAAPGPAVAEPLPDLKIVYETEPQPLQAVIEAQRVTTLARLELTLNAYKLSFRTSYDQLLCLPTLHEVESLWYQEETARKVIKTFRGRAILADEVGLGKTVEAGLILKEYLLRGLIKSALILTPSSLVNQWHEELEGKFGLDFATSNDPLFRDDPERFWQQPFLLVSLQTARLKRHYPAVTSRMYDLVIVDEAHHLKNHATLNWKLVNALQKTFILLLTATPVENKLEELYNLVTLLKPGHLKTRKAFTAEFVARGNPTDPINREKLRELLQEVMVRNTRSVAQLRLPPRFAVTVQVQPTASETAFYAGISAFIAQQEQQGAKGLSRMLLRRLLEMAGSSHFAAMDMLSSLDKNGAAAAPLIEIGKAIGEGSKVRRMLELVTSSPDQKIIFVNYRHTLEEVQQRLVAHRIEHVIYQGGMTPAKKQAAIQAFHDGCPVLLATDTGGEGHNLQFCHTMINYDLPWNPMRIEQRIGRIHRFGQTNEVQVYNFCAVGSIEEYILDILDRKINMFELVIGEIDMILGRLQGEDEFEDLVYGLWVSHQDEIARKEAFASFGAKVKRAQKAYEKSKEMDAKLFQEDFGV